MGFSSADGVEQWSRFFSWLLAAVCVIAIAYTLAKMTWFWWPSARQVEPPQRLDEATLKPLMTSNHAKLLAGLYLFGKVAKHQAPVARRVDAPETRLALELKGVVAGADGKSGGAIIADKEGDRFFLVGATLPGDVVLEEVFAQKVILLRNGRQETLKLISDLLKGGQHEGSGEQRGIGRNARSSAATQSAPAQAGTKAPGEINKAIRIRPIFRGGKVKGFRVSPGRNRRVFSRMGFRAGDLLTKINGVVPTDPKEIFSALNQLQAQGAMSVEVTRRGRPVALELKAP